MKTHPSTHFIFRFVARSCTRLDKIATLLMVILITILSCDESPPSQIKTPLTKTKRSIPKIDLKYLSPQNYRAEIFLNPILENGLIFWNMESSKRFKVENTSTEKGFFIYEQKKWKRDGRWYFFEHGILQRQSFYKKGVKEGVERVYDSLGAIVYKGEIRKNKKRFTFQVYDKYLGLSKTCFDYTGEEITCCPYVSRGFCGTAERIVPREYTRMIYGP